VHFHCTRFAKSPANLGGNSNRTVRFEDWPDDGTPPEETAAKDLGSFGGR
jgi:hypothetical protein